MIRCCAIVCYLVLLQGASLFAGGANVRVLLVGDSWSDYMFQDGSLRTVFAAEGRPDILEAGAVTAISGSTAADWNTPAMLQLISDELLIWPDLEVVQLTMGGNDFLAGMSGGGWHTGLTLMEEEALFEAVAEDVQAAIDHILLQEPGMQILLSFYDYPNFVETLGGLGSLFCTPLWNDLGQPTPLELNEVQTRFIDRIEQIAMSQPEVSTVRHLGLMQFHYGYPSMGIEPGDLPPPGDLSLPSPPQALRFAGSDCFHLNATGYQYIAQNLWDQFYITAFCTTPLEIQAALPQWPAAQSVADLIGDYNNLCM